MSSPSLTGISPHDPTRYVGPHVSLVPVVIRNRIPTGADIKQPTTGKYYAFGTNWIIGESSPGVGPISGARGDLWYLAFIAGGVATWIQFSPGISGILPVVNGGTGANTLTGVLVGNGTAPITGVPSINNGVLITSATGVVEWLANSSTPGYVLTANAGAPPSYQPGGDILTIDGDTGSVTGSTVKISGGTTGLTFVASGTTLNLTGTLIVGNGGTGVATFTPYMPVVGGTSGASALQSVADGVIGQVLQYKGAATLPVWASSILGSTVGAVSAGYMGEAFLSAVTTVGMSGSSANIASITPTAGNYILSASANLLSVAATSFSLAISTTSGSPTPFATGLNAQCQTNGSTAVSLSLPGYPIYTDGSHTYYLVGTLGTGSTNTNGAYISAIRIG